MDTNITLKAPTHIRTPTAAEQQLLDEIASVSDDLRALMNRIVAHVNASPDGDAPATHVTSPMRWAELALDDLQSGVMKARRAVMAPPIF